MEFQIRGLQFIYVYIYMFVIYIYFEKKNQICDNAQTKMATALNRKKHIHLC